MDDALTLAELERLARTTGIDVRREALPVAGGLCRVRGKWTLLLDGALSVDEQIELLVEALQGFDLTGVYVRPAVRQLLEPEGADDAASAQ